MCLSLSCASTMSIWEVQGCIRRGREDMKHFEVYLHRPEPETVLITKNPFSTLFQWTKHSSHLPSMRNNSKFHPTMAASANVQHLWVCTVVSVSNWMWLHHDLPLYSEYWVVRQGWEDCKEHFHKERSENTP